MPPWPGTPSAERPWTEQLWASAGRSAQKKLPRAAPAGLRGAGGGGAVWPGVRACQE